MGYTSGAEKGGHSPSPVQHQRHGQRQQIAPDAPRGFVRRRLRDKMPPHLSAPAATPVRHTMVECTRCGVPGRPEALPDGLCRACRPTLATAADCVTHTAVGRDVHALVNQLRGLTRTP